MSGSCIAAVGLQWGDEGKGKIIDWLSEDAGHVARFQGGNNAGHTVIVGSEKTVLHIIPSGVLRKHCHCYIGAGVVLDMEAFLEEVEMLKDADIDVEDRLSVSGGCSLVLPHHLALDEARENGKSSIGTTKRGIGPAHEDKVGRRAVKLADIIDDDYQERLINSLDHVNCQLVHLHGQQPVDKGMVLAWIKEHGGKIRDYVADVAHKLSCARELGEDILLEASQGALLDVEQGSYPFVTSAACISSASTSGLGVDLGPRVIGIAKAYTTRVGHGAFPTEIKGETARMLVEQGKEFGATTERERRIGWLDVPALRHALAINGCKEIALTKLDVLGLADRIKVCVEYSLEGKKLESWPASSRMLAECEPRYIEMAGWGDMAKPANSDDLPDACHKYLEKIEELCDTKVSILSHGPDRDATLWRERQHSMA